MAEDDENKQNENNVNYKSICCKQIPELFLDKLVAKNHFSKFGKINRFILRPNRLTCTVEYETEEDAERAYMDSGNFNGCKFVVNFAEREVAHVQNTEEWVNSPEVQAELDAMSSVQRMSPNAYVTRASPSQQQQQQQQQQQAAKLPAAVRTTKTPAPQLPTKAAPKNAVDQSKADTIQRGELEAILRRPALTDEDKYRALDARDKLIRLTTVRQTDIKTADHIKGFCPDMCPEKERLMREFQRQVSTFEMCNENSLNFGAIDSRRAIKEYSRSSADQEVPLAHDLRSESVLQMTMLYLMHRIMDLCDDPHTSIADWFHFVWDRTRSIRKDITQQELCSLGVVQLVEQCARFHIHCAARLVAEDPSVFDKKINAENLTKCLQTLKYMYHDLRIKNVPCPCEAEFRSYIVLLNLCDANFLWELKQLPEQIQQSPEIKRAIAFYNALQNNNYVRFFDMIRSPETSYLSACILLGYFTRLRLHAMEAIIKSHNWRKNAVFLPLPYITKILGFEDQYAAITFLKYHGLRCDEQRIMLERLMMPDAEYSMDRAIELVEAKRIVSVGECVRGGRLEPADIFENHVPHNSFDGNGLLKAIAWNADDQLRGNAAIEAAERNYNLQQQQMKQQQQQQQQMQRQQPQRPSPGKMQLPLKNAMQLTHANTVAPPKTEMSLFKVPHNALPAMAKPQKPAQQLAASLPSSIFGSDVKTTAASAFNYASPIFSSHTDVASSKLFHTESNATTAQANIFRMPQAFEAESASSSHNIFANAFFAPSNEKSTSAMESNIFGQAVAASVAPANFNFHMTPPLPQFPAQATRPEQPQLHSSNNNIFQNYLQPNQMQAAIEHSPAAAAKHIFGIAANEISELEQQRKMQKNAMEEERLRQQALEAKRNAEHKRQLQQLHAKADKECSQQLQSLLSEEIRDIAETELEMYRRLERQSNKILENVLAETVDEHICDIANEEHTLMCHDQMILERYFVRWREQTRYKIDQRKLLATTPMWITTETLAEQTAKLEHPCKDENLALIKRYRHGQACDFKKLLWHSPSLDTHNSIDIFRLLAKHVVLEPTGQAARPQSAKYFKLLLSLPAELEERPGFGSLCNKWLHKYLNQSKYASNSSQAFISGMERNIAVCVRKISGIVPINELGKRVRGECDYADGIICFMSCQNVQQTSLRVHNVLHMARIMGDVPLAIVVYDDAFDQWQLATLLNLDNFCQDGKLSKYQFFNCSDQRSSYGFLTSLSKALHYVADKSSSWKAPLRDLEMQWLQQWLEMNVGEEMWQRWQLSAVRNPAFGKLCSIPQYVVGVYNEALRRLGEILLERFDALPELPAELREYVTRLPFDIPLGWEHFPEHWRNPKRQEKLYKFVQKLQLPVITEPLPNELESMQIWLLNYASALMPHNEKRATEASYEAIKALIEQLKRDDLQDVDMPQRFRAISYLPVFKALIFTHVSVTLQHKSNRKLPQEVIYRRAAIEAYQTNPWWLSYEPINGITIDYSVSNDSVNAKRTFQEELDEVVQKAEAIIRRIDEREIEDRNRLQDDIKLTQQFEQRLLKLDVEARNCARNIALCKQLTDELDEQIERDNLNAQFVLNQRQNNRNNQNNSRQMNEQNNNNIQIQSNRMNMGDEVVDDDAMEREPRAVEVGRKRKYDESNSEMNAIIARAFGIVRKLEEKEDRVLRLNKILKFSDDED